MLFAGQRLHHALQVRQHRQFGHFYIFRKKGVGLYLLHPRVFQAFSRLQALGRLDLQAKLKKPDEVWVLVTQQFFQLFFAASANFE